MLRITERPHQGPPHTWTARDREEFCRLVTAQYERDRADRTLYEARTAREIAQEILGRDPATVDGADRDWDDVPAEVCEIGVERGWDTMLYMAAYLPGGDTYSVEPISEYEACVAYLERDLYRLDIEEVEEA